MSRDRQLHRAPSGLARLGGRLAASLWLAVAPAALPTLAGAALGLSALGLGAPGCSTPSVPLPPPVVDVSALGFTDQTGGLVLSGKASTAHENVRFFIVNRTTGDGVITTAAADGSFSAPPLAAVAGDVARIYFERPDGESSGVTCMVIVIGGPLFGETCL